MADFEQRSTQAEQVEAQQANPQSAKDLATQAKKQEVKARADDFEKGLEKSNQKTEIVELPEGTEFFQTSDGKIIAYSQYGDGIFISEDGNIFYELKEREYAGSSEDHDFSFENPHNETEGEFHRKENTITMNGETFNKIDSRKSIDAVRLPEVREVEYSFKFKNGEKLTVTSDKYNDSYESFKLFIGDREIPITNVTRMRDGGTTYIETTEGTLFSPTPSNTSKKPTWNSEELEK